MSAQVLLPPAVFVAAHELANNSQYLQSRISLAQLHTIEDRYVEVRQTSQSRHQRQALLLTAAGCPLYKFRADYVLTVLYVALT